MSEQDDFISDEEITAKANSRKIRRFIGNIGWQCIIFITVVYATIFSNTIATTGLEIYAWILGIACFGFFFTLIKPIGKLSMASNSGKMLLSTPTSVVSSVIATVFSICEIFLMFTYGFIFLAALWAVTEVLQYVVIYKLRLASHVPEKFKKAVQRQCDQNEGFEEKIIADIKEAMTEIDRIDKLANAIENDTDLDTKIQKETLALLEETREELITMMEDRITKAALETMHDQDLDPDSDSESDSDKK